MSAERRARLSIRPGARLSSAVSPMSRISQRSCLLDRTCFWPLRRFDVPSSVEDLRKSSSMKVRSDQLSESCVASFGHVAANVVRRAELAAANLDHGVPHLRLEPDADPVPVTFTSGSRASCAYPDGNLLAGPIAIAEPELV